MKKIELPYIKLDTKDEELLAKQIAEFFKKEIYLPLIKDLLNEDDIIKNSIDDLNKFIIKGRIYFEHGQFKGKFDSKITRELRKLGAVYDKKTGNYKINLKDIPLGTRSAIQLSAKRLDYKFEKINDKLKKILPEEIADKLDLNKTFDATLFKLDKNINATLKGISVQPYLTDEGRAKIAKEYNQNMKKYIQEFTETEISRLRKSVTKSFTEGNRYENMVDSIEKSYGVSKNKAKFLARQETNLLTSKFKETRYLEAGLPKYKWRCVAGSAESPVRDSHKKLDGKIFEWNDPPITDEKGNRNHPLEDFGCRCLAIPIVEFDE